MNCIYLKIKLNKKLECKKSNKVIILNDCANCIFKEYKMHNKANKTVQNYVKKQFSKMENKSPKLRKLEKNRFSLFTDDDSKCMLCGSKYQLTWNEIFRGKNRQNSMKYGLCQRLCLSCHRKYQDDKNFNDYWHKKGQVLFNKTYPDLDFVNIFRENYLK